jgi:uncharacterized repeat protein (TIGR03803 family)
MNILSRRWIRGFHLFSICGFIVLNPKPASTQACYESINQLLFVEFSSLVPKSPLIEGTNGALYGLSLAGGESQKGTVFRLNTNGTGFVVIHSFTGTNGDGSYPAGAALLLATNGFLFGTTRMGGANNFGTVFRIDHRGKNYLVLRSFAGAAGDGRFPEGLVQADNGMLYGTTYGGGDSNQGTVFRISTDGSGYTIVKSFAGGSTGSGQPFAPLTRASNGMLVGSTYSGGASNLGTIFALSLDGSSYQVLRSFAGPPNDGTHPRARLTTGADGWLYGTTSRGSSSNSGTAFRIKEDGSNYQVIKSFSGADGTNLVSSLILCTNGLLYGTAQGGRFANGTIFKLNPDGSSFQVIKNYPEHNEGFQPFALLQGHDGMLYGTTVAGGYGGQGTAFSLNLDGSGYTVIWNYSMNWK